METDSDVLAKMLKIANKVLKTTAVSWDDLVDQMLPPRQSLLKKLVVFYESEMVRCNEAKAYYAACVMAASMLESLLLMICLEKPEDVKATPTYNRRFKNPDSEFERNLYSLGFDQLIGISADLNWVPKDLIKEDWTEVLECAFIEIVIENRVHMSRQERERRASSLSATPAYSLMLLLNDLRNRVHGGRWLKEGRQFTSEEALSGWAQFALHGAAHIRDCYIAAHMRTMMQSIQIEMKKRIST